MLFLVFKTICHCPWDGWFVIAFSHYNNSLWIIYISFFNIKYITTRKPKLKANLYPLDTRFSPSMKFLRNDFLIFSWLYF
ncbi:hypothetical protein C2U43_04155 [Citrobacter freundii complex sp. CFNIH9]|nr:hypothetical protein C2U43_04155 [Citrobacter freundii complex sp. CFNIH9]